MNLSYLQQTVCQLYKIMLREQIDVSNRRTRKKKLTLFVSIGRFLSAPYIRSHKYLHYWSLNTELHVSTADINYVAML